MKHLLALRSKGRWLRLVPDYCSMIMPLFVHMKEYLCERMSEEYHMHDFPESMGLGAVDCEEDMFYTALLVNVCQKVGIPLEQDLNLFYNTFAGADLCICIHDYIASSGRCILSQDPGKDLSFQQSLCYEMLLCFAEDNGGLKYESLDDVTTKLNPDELTCLLNSMELRSLDEFKDLLQTGTNSERKELFYRVCSYLYDGITTIAASIIYNIIDMSDIGFAQSFIFRHYIFKNCSLKDSYILDNLKVPSLLYSSSTFSDDDDSGCWWYDGDDLHIISIFQPFYDGYGYMDDFDIYVYSFILALIACYSACEGV